ncbi:GNAT family N-acetyltransferase [Tissierella sp. MSJ-40]|uniref:GNAT family N-acetyltransferase n=1 Tax=Tissierella simiarum TaxID=2841534 RepID=A0ABS6E8C5_9FIRM|nr:GNAT family N-acetyltransferase [Tissierella simiarum]MBU5439156.1 GNAT family N-acetyltransferase [Tissierella simiarum]
MICELNKSQFYRCNDIVKQSRNIEGKAIIAGINPGRIFVDDLKTPKTAMIWQGNLDGFIFIGDSRNDSFNKEINNYINKVIKPQAKALGMEWFECISDNPNWYLTFEDEIFSDRKLSSWDQYVYSLTLHDFKSVKKPEIDQQYIVKKISPDILNDKKLQNLGFLESKIKEFWESQNDFFENGFGYCILHNNSIVSICMTGFRYKEIHGIDIETVKLHRGKNLAQYVAYSFVENCFVNGFTPYWDCMEVNYPSNAVAKRLGFKRKFEYKGYEFEL